ncbi:branched-chain amino acid ABC transporter permease [Dethiosulfatarculus sandiegensis]|uniref:ABC transporter permease n=1 Tax=Dethiosulfatarculus sandiegensis TaxID=1429043 RepID=A0A0D2HT71_9BACT|nr:branched-chain amino acid ABC transporter permease [Dethiosulfatarculus sandiegensis]KIX13733.1 ABC transporter permease [Dethiosulfatarculus sandiegensis]
MAKRANQRKERIDRGIKVRADGVYAISSWQEIGFLVGPRLTLILGLLLLPLVLTTAPYWQSVLGIVCIYSLLAVSFDFLAHYVGLVSLGGAFFVGVGAYISSLLNVELGLPLFVTIPLATVFGGAFCTLCFWPCLPLRGVYFAIVSLMFPLLAARVIEALDIFGGTDGVLGVEGFSSSFAEHYLPIASVLVLLFFLRRLVNEDLGLVLRGVKDNDQAVKASGININHLKALAVFISSSLGCLAGALLCHVNMWAGLSQFALDFSILPIAATVVGGSGTLVGPVLGCLILVPVSELLRDFGTLRIVAYAVILTGFIVFKSEGLMTYAARKYNQFERWVDI